MAELPDKGGVPGDGSGAGAAGEAAGPEPEAGAAGGPVPAGEIGAQGAPQPRRARLRAWLRSGVGGNKWALLVLVPLALMGGGYAVWWFTQEPEYVPASRIGIGSDIAPNPLEPTSEAYRIALAEGEEQRRDEAVEEGESFVPAMQSQQPMTSEEPLVAPPVLPQAKAPSERVREQVAQAVAKTLPAPAPATDPMVDRQYPQPRAVGTEILRSEEVAPPPAASAEALGVMFEDLFKVWEAPAPKMVVVRYQQPEPAAPASAEAPASRPVAGEDVAQPVAAGPMLVPAGTMVYATTRVGVDSELALPVLVEVLERPFSGALLRGVFEQVRDRMLIRFHRLSDARTGLDVEVNAYAVGLDCECGAVDGEVDRHWIARVVLPAAVGFAESYLEAMARPDVTVSVDGQVITQRSENDGRQRIAAGSAGAMSRVGDVLLEGVPKRATVSLPRGTELAVVFVDEVRSAEEARG